MADRQGKMLDLYALFPHISFHILDIWAFLMYKTPTHGFVIVVMKSGRPINSVDIGILLFDNTLLLSYCY